MYTPIVNPQYHSGAAAALAVALLSHPLGARAIDLGFGDWQIHGFLSQGYTYTSANNFFGNSQGAGSLEFHELGINVLGHPWPNLLVAAQGIYRDTAGSDEEDFRLDYANVDYSLPIGESVTLGVRAGRVKNPFGLYSEARDAIWTRPSVLLPQSIYFDSLGLRSPELSSDGGILYGRWGLGDHTFTAEFLVSEPNLDTAAEFLAGTPGGSLGGRPLFIGRAGYEWQEGRFRLLFTVVDLDPEFEPDSPDLLPGAVKIFAPLVSAQVNLEKWSFTGEYVRLNIDRSGIFPGLPPDPVAREFLVNNTAESYYLQAQYRFAPEWSAFARYDALFANADDHDGSATARGFGLPRHRFFAKDLTFGLRWEFAQNWLVAAEYHNIHGTAWLSPIDNPGINDPARVREVSDGHWDLFTLMFSYRF
ncbi:MAG: OprO/OprP family phosphate-selective porin [Pseudomonadota bacterium]|nr:OprO/OprP family phosphate-selective porin [Pseudomonadota bacterium]